MYYRKILPKKSINKAQTSLAHVHSHKSMIHTRNYITALDQLLSADAVNPWLYSLALFVLTVVCRLPFTSKLLYDQDAVQFALALENYDVYLQQPHPPGYFLYVMAAKAINLFAQNGNARFVLLCFTASGLTVV